MFFRQLVHDDVDVEGMALKCLSLLVQLFGGDHPQAMSARNMVRISVIGLRNIACNCERRSCRASSRNKHARTFFLAIVSNLISDLIHTTMCAQLSPLSNFTNTDCSCVLPGVIKRLDRPTAMPSCFISSCLVIDSLVSVAGVLRRGPCQGRLQEAEDGSAHHQATGASRFRYSFS